MTSRIAAAFGVVYLVAVVVAGAREPSLDAGIAAFANQFGDTLRLQRVFLFPLGVATSIVTILAIIEHMNPSSWRGRLQCGSLAALFGLGGLWAGLGEPIAGRILEAARAGSVAGVEALLGRWNGFRWFSFAVAAGAVTSLVVATRLPVVAATRGRLASLTPRHRTLLVLLGAATLFEGYDRFIVSLALPYIGDDLATGEGALGYALSIIRIGALASVALGRLADRYGRRRLLLLTILAYTISTSATGLSRGIIEFVFFQLLATIFLAAELSLAQVVVTEEFPSTFRALGQGFLGAFNALGAGLAALLFPVLQETAFGWRGLYFIGILPLLWIAWLRRAMPETERWERANRRGETGRMRLAELLVPTVRLRFLVLSVTAIAVSAAGGPAFGFASYRATKVFSWEPSAVSTMILIGGGLGFFGWFVFGTLAERLGRRIVGLVGATGAGIAVVAFYQTGWLFASFALLVFMEAGAHIGLNALGTELFPTRMRSTAKAWLNYASFLGAMLGLGIVGLLAGPLGSADAVVTLLGALPLLAAPSLFLLPEPRGRALEDVAMESVAS